MRRTLAAGLLALMAALPAAAQEGAVQEAELSDQARSRLNHIENYLNGLKTVKARFLQIASNGQVAEGTLYIKRPGRLRIEYDPPNPNLIVADGLWMAHYDKEMDQASYVLVDSTPAGILVDETVSFFGGDVTVVGYEEGKGTVRVTVVRTKDPGEGRLTLVLGADPLQLKKWRVVDAQGITTTVALQNARYNLDLKSSLFHLESRRR